MTIVALLPFRPFIPASIIGGRMDLATDSGACFLADLDGAHLLRVNSGRIAGIGASWPYFM